ncbi:MAG: hypothetical protein GEV08_20640 [Acidimicrobiia bacterium]|nr:hypothetical protein [Acidimicrobiia bacterium]
MEHCLYFAVGDRGRDRALILQLDRVATFLLGVFIMSLGVVASVRANLGTSPIRSFPTVLSLATVLSVGTLTILLNLLFLLTEILLLRRKFPPIQLIQFPVAQPLGCGEP